MTFATSAINRRRLSGFTLLELLLVIGIIGLLAAILLPAATRAWDRAGRLRTQSDLSAIATALEAYKSDFRYYPPVTAGNSGAATLGKALIGPYDAAHYYTINTSATTGAATLVASNTMQNWPSADSAYSGTKVYQAGDIVVQGNAPNFDQYIGGRQSTGVSPWNAYVCVRNDTQADGTSRAPTGNLNTDFWWAPILPYDGSDGPGIRNRLTSALDANDATHAPGGRIYGPYLAVERFRTNGLAILDRYGSPILYFPVNRYVTVFPPAAPAVTNFVARVDYPRKATGAGAQLPTMINANDNLGAFFKEGTPVDPVPGVPCLAKIRIMLGDYDSNGQNDQVVSGGIGEPLPPTTPFLLWTAGSDRVFGPRGNDAAAGGAYSLASQDFYSSGMDIGSANASVAAAVDDVTNFR